MIKIIVFFQIFFVLIGCAFVPKKMPQFDISNLRSSFQNCRKLMIRAAFVNSYSKSYKLGFQDLNEYEINRMSDDVYNMTLSGNIDKSGAFNFSQADNAELVLIFGIEQAEYNFGVTWITALTYGLIPTYNSGAYQMSLMVFSKDGQSIDILKANELEYTRYSGLLLLPFLYKKSENESEIKKKYIDLASQKLLSDFSQSKFYLEAAKCN